MDKLLIGDFEGPLDLLLHLIKKSKMEIFDIEISEITNQYLNYIKSMTDMNLDIAKSEEKEEDEEVEDPEVVLKRRLVEYQKYKESTNVFRDLEKNRSSYYTKAPESLKKYSLEKLENDGSVDVYDLLDAFQKLLERQEFNKPKNTKIARKELSVKERIVKIRDILRVNKRVNFVELFDDFSKPYVVVTFLSVLEMVKSREINIKQDNNFSDIYIERVD